MTTLYLMRHGEPEGGRKYRGFEVDDVLSSKGWDQMNQAILKPEHWDVVVSSPLKRCSEFSQQVANQNNIALDIRSDLKEIGFGHWSGKNRTEVKLDYAQEYELFYQNPVKNTPKNAEPFSAFYSRVITELKIIEQDYLGQSILLVAHAGVIRAIIASVLNIPHKNAYDMQIRNAALIKIDLGVKRAVYF